MSNGFQRWIRIICAVSLLLNLFFLGALLGRWLTDDGFGTPGRTPGKHPPGPVALPHPGEILSVLPKKDHGLVKNLLQKHKSTFRAHMESLGNATEGLADALAARPFDRERLVLALDRVRETGAAIPREAQDVFLELAVNLDPQGRQLLAKLVREQRRPPGPPPGEAPAREDGREPAPPPLPPDGERP